jgi:hypothetical protein
MTSQREQVRGKIEIKGEKIEQKNGRRENHYL